MDRISKIRRIIEERSLDAVYLLKETNVSWASGFRGDSSVVIITRDSQYFITDSRYTEEAEKEIDPSFKIIEIRPEIRDQVLNDIFVKNGVKYLGIEGSYMTVKDKSELDGKYDFEYSFIDDDIIKLRAVKDENEIISMKKAAKLTEECFYYLLPKIKEGVSENDIFAEMCYFFNKNGATGSFEPIIAGGPNSSMPHAKVTSRKLEKYDLLTMDFGCKINGYCSDFTRTLAISGIEPDMKRVYNIVRNAQRLAMDFLRPGVSGFDADKIARDHIYSNGYEGLFGHSLGHGVGLDIHESPRLSRFSDDIMEKDMAVTVEPGIYIPGKGGVRIEDTVLITEDGMVSLYTVPTDLIIL
jgi:Xaa-Pro aminopeptidase